MFYFDNYLKRAIFTLSVTVTLTALGAAISASDAIDRINDIEATIKLNEDTSKEVENDISEEKFTVKDSGGRIGVFGSDGKLVFLTEIYTKTLPASDRELLREGFTAYGREELYEILGDYDA